MRPLIDEEFDQQWTDKISPDDVWRVAGPWVGTGGNQLDPSLARINNGQLSLTVKANELRGSELQTLGGYSYGYYETSMKVSAVPGVVNSFFWIQEGYGPREWDVEFTTNDPWINSPNSGQVKFHVHPSGEGRTVDLPFNPSLDFHRYGFLWEPGKLSFTVDGVIKEVFYYSEADTSETGYIMMNAWTGNPNFGGGPPSQDATAYYDWVRYFPDSKVVRSLVEGDNGSETLNGAGGYDTILSFGGDDRLNGLGGDDDLRGAGGNDRLFGGVGGDKLFGGTGNDSLVGEAGDDRMRGGAGRDTIDGGAGDDIFWGDEAADTFVFRATGTAQLDRILDFDPGADVIAVNTSDYDTSVLNGDVVIAFGNDEFLVVRNFTNIAAVESAIELL